MNRYRRLFDLREDAEPPPKPVTCVDCGCLPGMHGSVLDWQHFSARCALCPTCKEPKPGDNELLALIPEPVPEPSESRPQQMRTQIQPPSPEALNAGLLH